MQAPKPLFKPLEQVFSTSIMGGNAVLDVPIGEGGGGGGGASRDLKAVGHP